jgi:serine/threonine protein kinase
MSLPLTANTVDAAALADELARFRVIEAGRLNELLSGFSGVGSAALAEYLVGRSALTPFQAERALAGEARVLVLGPYRLTGRAGRGTFGPLFTANHTSKPGAFVVRVQPLRSLWQARQAKPLARFLSAGVPHPAVAPLLEVDSANGFHYLVWPQVEGPRLAERVSAGGPLSPGEAAALLGHLAGALATCHARGAVHGALTPHTVALALDGLPVLLELGAGALLAQNVAEDESLFDSMSAAFASADVLTYAAPELADAPNAPNPAVDQYALGAVGYFALTGLPPYPHPTLADLVRAKRAGPPPSAAIVNPVVSNELAQVIERMMAPTPTDRFPALAEVEQQFSALAQQVAAEEPHPEPPDPGPAPESLLLSQLPSDRPSSGSIAWSLPRSDAVCPAERDETDASITFDLPEAVETVSDALPPQPPPRAPEPALAAVPAPRAAPVDPPSNLGGSSAHDPDALRTVSDPRLSAPTPVQWHTAAAPDNGPGPDGPSGPPANSVLWKRVRRNLLFWQAATDTIAVSVYGPVAVAPGQSVKLVVFLHTPDAGGSVRTLARALQHDAELIGSGYLVREVARESELVVHVSVVNAGVAQTQFTCQWRGQPRRIGFDLHVPWESPDGASPGLVSVGHNNVRIGKIEFRLNVLPRKA